MADPRERTREPTGLNVGSETLRRLTAAGCCRNLKMRDPLGFDMQVVTGIDEAGRAPSLVRLAHGTPRFAVMPLIEFPFGAYALRAKIGEIHEFAAGHVFES